jgi:hypothetical protein
VSDTLIIFLESIKNNLSSFSVIDCCTCLLQIFFKTSITTVEILRENTISEKPSFTFVFYLKCTTGKEQFFSISAVTSLVSTRLEEVIYEISLIPV